MPDPDYSRNLSEPTSQILSLGTTATNTFTTELQMAGVSIPAFQSFFNYVLLLLVYTPFTMYRYGFKGWLRMVWRQGWKCMSSLPLVGAEPESATVC